ncbi:hypothetical protein [Paraburkholderia kirstenboschensis]|nr:hypothetical protein [Paraburkholderia kirstenboschensis]
MDVDHIDPQFGIGECSRLSFRILTGPHLKAGKVENQQLRELSVRRPTVL